MTRSSSARDAGRPERSAVIATERLRLVPLTAADAQELHPVLDDVGLHRFIGGAPLDLAALRERFARLEAGAPSTSDETWANWVVRVAATGEAVGTVQATVHGDEATVAWVVGPRWQGRGFGSEAARALVEWLLGAGVVRVTAHIHPDHHASAAVARHAGLRSTGRRDDHGEVVWSAGPDERAG